MTKVITKKVTARKTAKPVATRTRPQSAKRGERAKAVKLTSAQLRERDAKRNIWQEVLTGIRDIKAGRVGTVHEIKLPQIVETRLRLGLSQSQFATLLGVSARTLQEWEQCRRAPTGAAVTLLRIAERHPEVLRELIAA